MKAPFGWIVGSLVLLGCGSRAETVDVASSTLESRLEQAAELEIGTLGAESIVTLRVGGSLASEPKKPESLLPVQKGSLTLSRDSAGALVLDSIDFEVDDVVVDADTYPPNGVHLTDLRLVLSSAAPLATTWSDEAATATGTYDLELSWSVIDNDDVVPLADQALPDLPVEAHVRLTTDDAIRLDLSTYAAGTVWVWGRLLTMSDFQIELVAETP